MPVNLNKNTILAAVCLLLIGTPFMLAGELDRGKYIGLDEIKPGMKAYCLTTYKGTEIEKFDLDVVSVVRNMNPGKNAILVQGTDERFIHSGPVAGCSGSPVYIDGRLAGALAFGWAFSKDPLYGVTPIEDMLRLGEQKGQEEAVKGNFTNDFSQPLDLNAIYSNLTSCRSGKSDMGGVIAMPSPLVISGMPAGVCEKFNENIGGLGLIAVAGVGGSEEKSGEAGAVKLAPGAAIAVPLVSGDLSMAVIGTVTEVEGNKVYAFGHSFLGQGPVELPMATAKVHTVVSSMMRSIKVASVMDTVGAVKVDESMGVYGQIGESAHTIPLTIRVERFNDSKKRIYNCQIADNESLTPDLVKMAVAGAGLMLGDLPSDHEITYKVCVGLNGAEPIKFENLSSGTGFSEMLTESISSVGLLMNNPYKKVDINSLEFDIRIQPKSVVSHLWSVDISDSKVKQGQSISVTAVVESVLANKREYNFRIDVPKNLKPGRYDLIVCGGNGYLNFMKKNAPYKFQAENLSTLMGAMNNILAIRRDRLYCIFMLPSKGVTVETAELPDLPATRTMMLVDSKRGIEVQPYSHWIEKSIETGTVVNEDKVLHIMVEEER